MNTTTSPVPAIEVTDLHKSFGAVRAVDGLSLTVQPGEILAFLGPNGAGKSTTLDVIMGFTQPSFGTVRVLGTSPAQAARRGMIGAVLQNGGLLPDYSVREILTVVASLHAGPVDLDAAIEHATLGGLLARKISRLSGGERQRLRMALALLADPSILVLDEPTTGMDVTARADFWATMRDYAARGCAGKDAGERAGDRPRTLIFATHYLTEAAEFADRIVIIDHGRLVADGTIDDLRGSSQVSTVGATWPGATESAVRAAFAPLTTAIDSTTIHGDHVEIRTTASDDVARLLLTATPARGLSIQAPSIDDIFSTLVSQEG